MYNTNVVDLVQNLICFKRKAYTIFGTYSPLVICVLSVVASRHMYEWKTN